MDKKISIGKDAQVWIVWNVASIDYSESKIEEIKEKFANKYGISSSNVKVTPNFVNKRGESEISLNQTLIDNIQNPKFHQELFVDFLEERGIKDYDIDALVKIDNQINSLIDYDSYEKGRRYELKWLDWDNFLSYGPNNHFDFTDLHGLVLLNGVPANQSGKSTFAYDLLHFLFFGKTTSGKADTLSEYFNNKLPNETKLKVEGCINIGGTDYVIRRTLTRPSLGSKNRTASQKIEYYKLTEAGTYQELSEESCMNEENGVKTAKAIKEAIGNERDFDMVISANARSLTDLISVKDTERGRLLARWIGLLPLEDKDIKAREKWNKEISQNRYCLRYNKESLTLDNKAKDEENERLKVEIEHRKKGIEDAEKAIKKENELRDAYLSGKKKIDSSLMGIDIVTLRKKIETITENGKIKRAEMDGYEQQINAIGDVDYSETDYKNSLKEKDAITVRISEIKNSIRELKVHAKALADGEYCPVCKRKFDNVDNSAAIKENEEKVKALTKEGVMEDEKKAAIEKVIAGMEEGRVKFMEKNKLELRKSACNVELGQLISDYKEENRLLKDIQANSESIEENNRLDALINICNENIKVMKARRDGYYEETVRFDNMIKNNENQIKENKFIIERINEEAIVEKNWKTYLMLIGKDGISKMVLRKALPLINNELKRLLDDVCDFDVEVAINEKNDVEFYLITNDVKQKLSAGSGFEQTAAALALRVVLGSMSSLSKPPFILLDEVLGGVAKENYDNIKKLYDRILTYYSFIFQITHLEDIVDWHDMVVTVKKGDDKISHIAISK